MDRDFMDFLNNLEGVNNKIEKTNHQRVMMSVLLTELMKNKLTPIVLKSSIAASVLDMLESTMIQEDTPIINMLNAAVDSVCEEAKEHGVSNLRQKLTAIRKETAEQVERVRQGEAVLKSLNLDNLNLN